MAEQNNIGFSVSVNSNDATKSLKELRAEIDQTTKSVEKLGEQYGQNSKEVEAAQKRLQQLQDLSNQKQEENTQRLDNAAKTVSALSAAYGGVQGALELTGLAGEDTIKQLAKIQSALAIGDAVQNLAEFRGAIVSTFTELRTGAVKAFQAIKAGIGATGIGALLLALGGIVAYWDDIKAAVGGVSEEQKKLLADTQADAKAQQDKLSTIDSQDNILKLQGKSEKEILGIKIKQTEEVISATEKQVQQQKIVLQAQLTAEKRNKEILQGIVRFLLAPLTLILGTVDKVGKALGKDFGLEEKFSGGLANLIFDPKETEKKGQEEIAALDKTLNDLKNKRAGYQLSVQAINKQASDTAKTNADKLAEEENARLEKQLADEKKLTEDLLSEYDKRKKASKDAKILTQKEIAALDEQDRAKQEEENNKKFDAQIAFLGKTTNYTIQKYNEDQKFKEDQRVAELKADEELNNLKFDAATAGLNLLSSLAGENEKIANAMFVIDKAMAIAKIVVDTQREIAGYFASNSGIPLYGAALAAKLSLAAKIRAGIGIASIAATSIAKFKGGGTAGGSALGGSAPTVSTQAPIAPPQPQTTTLSSQSINALGSQTSRAYVVESDVTSSQQRIAAIQQRARFG
jgi:hypothetical protein